MNQGNRLRVELLGTSFTIQTHEDRAYLERILWYFEKKLEETQKKSSITDPLKISILTSFSLIDELMREKSLDGKEGVLSKESEEMERITLKLITEIKDTLDV